MLVPSRVSDFDREPDDALLGVAVPDAHALHELDEAFERHRVLNTVRLLVAARHSLLGFERLELCQLEVWDQEVV